MKKCVSLIIAICTTGAAYAGTVLWTSDAVKGDTQLNGAIAFLFVGSDTSSVASAIQDGTFDYNAAIATTHSYLDEGYGTISVSGIGDYKNQEVSLYMVLFDTASVTTTSNFAVGGPVSKSFSANGNKTFDFSSSIASATWAPVSTSPTPPGPGPIPEPTTAALLALGLAAVGLKRKVA